MFDIFSVVKQCVGVKMHLKGGYLDFSHLTELKNISGIYIKKQYKSSRIKNHKITKNIFLIRFP